AGEDANRNLHQRYRYAESYGYKACGERQPDPRSGVKPDIAHGDTLSDSAYSLSVGNSYPPIIAHKKASTCTFCGVGRSYQFSRTVGQRTTRQAPLPVQLSFTL